MGRANTRAFQRAVADLLSPEGMQMTQGAAGGGAWPRQQHVRPRADQKIKSNPGILMTNPQVK